MNWTQIGEALRRLRLRRGLSQREVAEGAKVSHGYISLLENGQRNATLEVLEACTEVCGGAIEVVIRPTADADWIELLRVAGSLEPEDLRVLLDVGRALPAVEPVVKRAHARALTALAEGGRP